MVYLAQPIGIYGGGFNVVLVVYVNLRFAHSDYNAYWRKDDVETLSETHQWHGGIQDNSLHEKYGYLEICA